MNTIRIKKVKIGSAVTNQNGLVDAQDVITQWSKCLPKVVVCGDMPPPKGDGIRHIKFTAKPTLVTILGHYMRTVPGAELAILAEPEYHLSREGIEKFLDSIQSLRPDMGFGGFMAINGEPVGFVVSTPIIAHLIRALPTDLTFASSWREVVHAFLSNSLRHKYQDLTQFGIMGEIPAALPVVIEIPSAPAPRKKGPLRKVKVA